MMEIRRLVSHESFEAAASLEALVWGNSDPIPVSLLTVFAHHGGAVLGAFQDGQLAGTSVGFVGLDHEGRAYLHSHLLAVLPSYRGRRVGTALKHAQWDYAKERGLPYIGWTFDPLMAANAWFNIGVLGARIDALQENVYGELEDGINGNLPTHRVWVTWPHEEKPRAMHPVEEVLIPGNVSEVRRRAPDAARHQSDAFFQDMGNRWTNGWRIRGARREGDSLWYQWVHEQEDQNS